MGKQGGGIWESPKAVPVPQTALEILNRGDFFFSVLLQNRIGSENERGVRLDGAVFAHEPGLDRVRYRLSNRHQLCLDLLKRLHSLLVYLGYDPVQVGRALGRD